MAADNMLRIEADRSDITLNMMDLEDYPELQFSEKVKSIKINVPKNKGGALLQIFKFFSRYF